MDMSLVLCFICYFLTSAHKVNCKGKLRSFPDHFIFGASSSAYQIEGGWNEDGKSDSIWDVMVHESPSLIKDFSTGDVAADSYHKYPRDIEIMKELGLEFYKFSISWTRILPNGFADKVNTAGLDYYGNLIDGLLHNNITPFVSMNHFDLPNNLQKLGGWANPAMVVIFRDYAKVLFSNFGYKVRHWMTIDQPDQVCHMGYGSKSKAPMINMTGLADYMCAKNVLLAHAEVFHLYDDEFRKLQNGTVGISLNLSWFEQASDTLDDYQAALDARQFDWGLYAHPIFSKLGDYPQEVKHNVAFKSAEQGYPRSRLPELTALEVAFIRGSADFLGVNSFTTRMTYRDASLEGMYAVPSYKDDIGSVMVKDPSWHQSASSWLQEVPWGFTKLLIDIKNQYDNPPVYVTGNGWSTTGGLLDEARIYYMRAYLGALLDAVYEGCNVKGYSVWALLDTFEWRSGYTEKFGLYEVDFASPEKTRTPRKSAFIYKEIIRSKILDPDFEPESFIVEIRESQEKDKDLLY